MIRLTYLLRRRPGMSRDDFQSQWRTIHGPLVASHAFHLECLRHVQVHAIEIEDRPESSGPRGVMEPPWGAKLHPTKCGRGFAVPQRHCSRWRAPSCRCGRRADC